MSHPEIHVKDWIDVGNSECVVQRLLPPGSPSGGKRRLSTVWQILKFLRG
ncbi:hypothetical protein MLW93_005166 [Klebsiella pneumoniae]|nr:hypothetical protein [Klebsiella pneumoniae]